MLDFEVQVASSGACAVVTVRGEVDLATAPQLETALERAARDGLPRVVVDLRGTGFIDSTGLATLFRAHKAVTTQGREFAVVCGPDTEVRRVIALMRFDEVFNLHASLDSVGCEDAEPSP